MKKSWILISAYFIALGVTSVVVLPENIISINDHYIPDIKVKNTYENALWVDPEEWYHTSTQLDLYSEIFSDKIVSITILNETRDDQGRKITYAKIFGNYPASETTSQGILVKQITYPEQLRQIIEITNQEGRGTKIEQKTTVYEDETGGGANGKVQTEIDLSLSNKIDPLRVISEDSVYEHMIKQIAGIGKYVSHPHEILVKKTQHKIFVDPEKWYNKSIQLEIYNDIFLDEIKSITILNQTENAFGGKTVVAEMIGNYPDLISHQEIIIKQTTIPDERIQIIEFISDEGYYSKIEQKTINNDDSDSLTLGTVETKVIINITNKIDPLHIITDNFAYQKIVEQIVKIGEHI